jgi:hypothetical protein
MQVFCAERNLTPCGDNCCNADEVCQGGIQEGICTCLEAGKTTCTNRCVDLQTDPANCGVCGDLCPAGTGCQGGTCLCSAGLPPCGDVCPNLSTDPANCGACGVNCAGNPCIDGVCSLCAAGLTDCGGVCVDLMSDQDRCGSCESGCIYGELCTGGVCQPICGPGLSYCNDVCVNTASDPANCGACFVPCEGVCDGGTCLLPSDRTLKANFRAVDPVEMLQQVRELPISTWNYTSEGPAIRHVGPMAQDFATRFGLGADDRHISTIDGLGVALAAIQGLVTQVEELRAENVRLAAQIAAMVSAPGGGSHGRFRI